MEINLHRRCVLLSDAFYCMNMPFRSLIINVVYLAFPKSLCIEKMYFLCWFLPSKHHYCISIEKCSCKDFKQNEFEETGYSITSVAIQKHKF